MQFTRCSRFRDTKELITEYFCTAVVCGYRENSYDSSGSLTDFNSGEDDVTLK